MSQQPKLSNTANRKSGSKAGSGAGTGGRTIDISPEQMKKIRGYQLMVAGAIFLILPGMELYRRLYKDGERKIQEGEYNPLDGSIKEYSEEEKIAAFKNSWITRIFGEK